MKINSVNPSYFIINKVNGNFEDINKNKYLTLAPSNESKEKIKKYEELRSKIKDLIRSVTKNADNYDKKYIKIKINSNGELPLNKMTEIHGMVPTAVAFFHQNNKNYPQTFLTLLGLGFLALLRTGGGWIPPPTPRPYFLKNGIRYKAEIW